MKKEIKNRKSNIELLRIIAMLMIIAHHIAVHSGFEFSHHMISVNRLWIQFIQIGGKIGVDIFVLISGYFLIRSDGIKIDKILKLWLQIFTYSVVFWGIFSFSSSQTLEIREGIKSFFPITYSKWWFASTYFLLILLAPFINKMLNSFKKTEYQRFLVLLFFCWCIIPTFLRSSLQSNTLLWFIYLYSLAGYIRLYPDAIRFKSRTCFVIAFSFVGVTFLSAVVFMVLGTKISFFASKISMFYDMQSLPILIIALMIFIGFINMDIRYIPMINVISSATFGVYLIHDNEYCKLFLWKDMFKMGAYQDSPILIGYSVFVIMVVFLGCTVIELIRKSLLEKIYMKKINGFSVFLIDILVQ